MKNRTSKLFFSLMMAIIMVLSLSVGALAADSTIEFKGFTDGFAFEPGSEYTETDLFDNFKNVMPGDVLTEEITFTNSAADCDFINLYMRAQPHDEAENPLSPEVAEEETLATMTEFLSQLSMKVYNGTELIYDASPDETDGLTENVLLGTFRTGDTAKLTVELTVPAELGNEFAFRVGEVDWVFHVEAYSESQLTVRKIWSDGNANHEGDTVKVNLLKDGKTERSEVLSAENQWTFTFDKLVEGCKWTVEEDTVPEGYTVSYETVGNTTTITNTKDEPLPPEPGEPVDITVKKVWDDNGKDRPEYVTVTLYDGKTAVDTVKLSAANNWSHTWEDLSAEGNWQVTEVNIPKGYTPSYSVKGETVTITNTAALIHTGQLNWPIFALAGAGVLMLSLGLIVILKKKNRHA